MIIHVIQKSHCVVIDNNTVYYITQHFVNVNDLNQWEQQTSLKASSFDGLKQKIIVPINHREIVECMVKQNVDLFAEKDTDLGKTNTIKMSIDTGNHPPSKL